jgi:tRNA pseudouridine38-40 synthase
MGRAFLLTLQFDGSDFCGWQRQREGRTVQAEVERALSTLAGTPTHAIAAGRTDAGVHALAMPVSATMPPRWTAADLLHAANSLLPPSIAVSEVRAVRPGTDARRQALSRRYRYDVGISGCARSPLHNRRVWPLARHLDLESMQSAAEAILGEHDFRGFAAVGEPKPHYRCWILEAAWTAVDTHRLRFTVAADRFLHHMVRFLVGTMVEVGLGRREVSDMTELLTSTDNSRTAPPAPAAGLAFLSARYPPEIFLEDTATW